MTFRNNAAEFVFVRTYARWIEDASRRESWSDTVNRYITYIEEERGTRIPGDVLACLRQLITDQKIMPSMRAMWAAGDAARADSTTVYNCAFLVINSIESFSELLYILMCGTGVGFRVLPGDVDKLPDVPAAIADWTTHRSYTVEDSRSGWANSVKNLLSDLYQGFNPAFDYSDIRPRGARLKTMGGRASGPEPLIRLHEFIREKFQAARGRKLTTLECHDICNMIAEIVVVGGVRRSSQISLSALDDTAMRDAKTGEYPHYRAMANNSAVYETKPDEATFWVEWEALKASGSGERGIFNLEGGRLSAPERRYTNLIEGVNPCGEILLRSKQYCNLSEVVVRAEDTVRSLHEKVYYATWLGAIQSTFTNFPYLSPQWAANCEEERLLGVSLTGQMDAPHLMTKEILRDLKATALRAAEDAARRLGINMPAAVTCVKPSGTVSQLVDASSGMHPRYAPYYIRRYRISGTDPLYRLMRDQGIEFHPEIGQGPEYGYSDDEVQTWVCSFPVAAPVGAITRNDVTAVEQLEFYKLLMENWCEHNASLTVYVGDDEWQEVGEWVYRNWASINGVSFLPRHDFVYKLAPYEEITHEEYLALASRMPRIAYELLETYEREDNTIGSQEVACSGGSCEIP